MSVIDNMLERLNEIEDKLQELEEVLQIEEPEDDDIYSTDIVAEDAYPDCKCDDVCEECDTEYVEQ
jgi:hypothetical protein